MLAVIVLVVVGGLAGALAVQPEPGPPVDVAPGVRISPLAGWEVVGRLEGPPGIRLTRGNGVLDVRVAPFQGSGEDLYRTFADQLLRPQATQLSVGEPQPIRLASGLEGVRGGFVGFFRGVATPVEGEVTAVVSADGRGVVFNAYSAQGQLARAIEEIRQMIDRTEVS